MGLDIVNFKFLLFLLITAGVCKYSIEVQVSIILSLLFPIYFMNIFCENEYVEIKKKKMIFINIDIVSIVFDIIKPLQN